MIEVEKMQTNRYRLRSHGHIVTVSAQDLVELYDYLRIEARIANLRAEARTAMHAEAVEKGWLPIQPGEEF